MEVLSQLQTIFRDVFDDDNIVITRTSVADDVDDWDSLAQVNLILCVERFWGIKFSLDEISNFKNVGQLVDLIEKKIGV
ncbi:MAG: acyl carrier protein [Epulopiscium sp. Nuni2H_MBin001]|nr:MAG: acyl carrier protein [Epulopiscium sp. Nuni2H_MBin001]